jgi:hypothetical protein
MGVFLANCSSNATDFVPPFSNRLWFALGRGVENLDDASPKSCWSGFHEGKKR